MKANLHAPQRLDAVQQEKSRTKAPAIVRMIQFLAGLAGAAALIAALLSLAGFSGETAGAVPLWLAVFVVAGLYLYGIEKGVFWLWHLQAALTLFLLGVYALILIVHFFALKELVEHTLLDAFMTSYLTGALVGSGFGIVLNGIILYFWMQPDTKRWFIRGGRQE